MPPKDFGLIQKSKNFGYRQISFNLECYDPKVFKEVCPGKDELYGYKMFMDAFDQAVKVYGPGNVRSNFVLGAEPAENLIRGAKEFAERGIVADYSIFFPRPGSPWSKKKAPKVSDVIDVSENLVGIYKRYGFKPFCCSLSSRSSIMSEMYAR
jgi:hypothetical protein